MFENLKNGVNLLGKPQWRAMLSYVAQLHEDSTHPGEYPFIYPWEEIGPGYVYGPAFGHIDITHQALDTLAFEPEHSMQQILNNLELQSADGLVPGVIWMRYKHPQYRDNANPADIPGESLKGEKVEWSLDKGYPPLWPVLIEQHSQLYDTLNYINKCYENLIRQIRWFENFRSSPDGGFYYLDILGKGWESGVDDGIRYINAPRKPLACVDATSHMYMLYDYAYKWAARTGRNGEEFKKKADSLKSLITIQLFSEDTGLFHDIYSVNDSSIRKKTFEGMWPMVVGAASEYQANRVIDDNLLNPKRFFSPHPITTVSMDEPLFELRMWRGPVWNCMTMWAAIGCMKYGRKDAARKILERALDAIAIQYEKTGTVWEFYHPFIGNQLEVQRKPYTPYNEPCRDYLGHMPAIAMAGLWEKLE